MSASVAALRRFVGPRGGTTARCALCATELGEPHEHLLEPMARRLECACIACALLFDREEAGKLRRVGRTVRAVAPLSDEAFRVLGLPVELAFVGHRSVPHPHALATFPSALGAVDLPLDAMTWARFVEVARPPTLRADVEALFLDRERARAAVVPIDRAFALVGRMRERESQPLRAIIDAWVSELALDRGAGVPSAADRGPMRHG